MGFSVIPEPAISGFTGPQGPAGVFAADQQVASSVVVTNAVNSNATLVLAKNSNPRWKILADSTTAEDGTGNGSDLRIESYADDGTTKKNDVLWASRINGQVVVGATSTQGGVKLSVNGAIGTRDLTANPATTGLGAQFYSKAGKPWVQTASGASAFEIVNALPLTGGTVTGTVAVNGTFRVTGASGSYRSIRLSSGDSTADRWSIDADAVADDGAGGGSNFRLARRNDDGTFNSTTVYATRNSGQVVIGGESPLGPNTLSVVGGVGLKDQAADPATASGGAQLYSKSGLPYIKQGDGTVFQVGAVTSVNTKTGAVTLVASDVGALKANDSAYQTGVRAIFQGDGTNNIMEWRNPSGGLAARIGANGNFVGQGAMYSAGGLQVGSSSTNWGGGAGAMLGLNDGATIPTANPTAGLVAYSEGGILKVRQSDGTIVVAQNAPSSFTPESLSALAWAGDPGTCTSGGDYSGVGQGRMTAVYVNRTMTISKIVWHMMGYSGGLLTGSWAGIYDTAGTLKAATGDMSTATYEPATQSAAGGGWSSSPLTASVTLAPGVYYVCWRFSYTASPVDGPQLMRWDSVNTCSSVMGVSNSVWRFAKFTSSATSAPSSFAPSTDFQRNSLQFWVALA